MIKSKLTFRSLGEISEVFSITKNTVFDVIKKHKIKKEVMSGKNYIDIEKFYNIYIKHYNPGLFSNDTENTENTKSIKKINQNIKNIFNDFVSIDNFLCKTYKVSNKSKLLPNSLLQISNFK